MNLSILHKHDSGDDTLVSNIINLLTSNSYANTDDVSSETSAAVDRIINTAWLALLDPAIDRENLYDNFSMLVQSIDNKRRATVAEKLSQRFRFLAGVGDWVAGIVNIAKSLEGEAQSKHHSDIQSHLKATGISARDARTYADGFRKWKILQGTSATDCWNMLKGELQSIRSWFLDGQPAGKEPETPGLDRIKFIAQLQAIEPQELIDAIHLYSDRNSAFHGGPPDLDKFVGGDGKVDWHAVEADCKEKKASLDNEVDAGTISAEQRDQFHLAIDNWFTPQKESPNAGEVRKVAKPKPVVRPLPSYYVKDKWKDFDYQL
ncbi:hypothetical protein B0I37DRAFT_417270 [Chaetomium sp. MPI-CAGE-AT-0009]|nr:hypothetical protein B0I37DRAFT_417270 [Chaetomium sp. MPI-CAGE-AT-0009]